MKIAWNWIGIIAWMLILIYFIWMMFSIHNRYRMAIQKNKKFLKIKTSVMMIIFQIIILLFLVSGMLILRLHNGDNKDNVSVKRYYEPMVLDTNGRHSYYVKVRPNHRSLNLQTYSYLTNGHREYIDSASAILCDTNEIKGIPLLYGTSKVKLNELDRRYQRAWSIRVVDKYKNNWLNGLSLRANTDASYHVLIRVPDDSFVYIEK